MFVVFVNEDRASMYRDQAIDWKSLAMLVKRVAMCVIESMPSLRQKLQEARAEVQADQQKRGH